MRTSFGKVLVGYDVPVGPDVNAEVLKKVYSGLPGMFGATPPSIDGDVWRMAVYYREFIRDDPAWLRDEFQKQLEKKLGRRVEVQWFNVDPVPLWVELSQCDGQFSPQSRSINYLTSAFEGFV